MTTDTSRPAAIQTFEGRPLPDPTEPAWDQGLAFDVETLIDRRRVLKGIGLAGLSIGIAACAPGSNGSSASATAAASERASSTAAAAADCATEIPEETAGPFPGDGSNGPDALGQSGVVRKDIRSSFGTSSTVAAGVPLTVRFAVLDMAKACEPFAGAAIYAWHCDQEGRYSMYSQGVENENYLRGVQAAGADGIVEFTSVFPACYQGRWPHVHFEVYRSLEAASNSANRIATSQIALPKAICDEVYATPGYEQSVSNMSQVSLERDMVFADGAEHQLGTMSGTVADGLTVELAVPVQA
ncbi:MAG TPA: intradiol ring-cleavage dioxygenase [Candidatus Limnocylindrales bacterium]|nr:intradiol ring-cleavage dioxygenase [Candidatus Limnocylindrales bacterium]